MGTDRLRAHLSEPVDRASLDAFRVVFGLLMLVGVIRFFAYGWIHEQYIAPRVFFGYPGFEWVTPWPGVGMYVHFAVLGVLALLVALGVWTRAALVGFFFAFAYVELLDRTNYLNHYYLVSIVTALLICMPHRAGASTAPRWCLWALRLQFGLVYFFAGVAKLNPSWLLDAQPLRIWLAASTDLPLVGPFLGLPWVAYAAAWAGAAFDLTAPFALLWHRTRPFAFAAVVGFHLFTWALFSLGLFPWIMIAGATLFFAPAWPRRWLPVVHDRPPATHLPARLPRWGLALLAAHFALQVTLPLRHHLVPGNVLWNEEGMRFAWHVMLVEKAGSVTLRVREPGTDRSWEVHPEELLSPRQAKMASTQPDMLLQLARFVAADFARAGHPDVEVRADAFVSVNGRRSRRLVDPDLDLLLVGDRPWLLDGGLH